MDCIDNRDLAARDALLPQLYTLHKQSPDLWEPKDPDTFNKHRRLSELMKAAGGGIIERQSLLHKSKARHTIPGIDVLQVSGFVAVLPLEVNLQADNFYIALLSCFHLKYGDRCKDMYIHATSRDFSEQMEDSAAWALVFLMPRELFLDRWEHYVAKGVEVSEKLSEFFGCGIPYVRIRMESLLPELRKLRSNQQ